MRKTVKNSSGSVNNEGAVGIDPVSDDIIQENRERIPELRPLIFTLALQCHHGAARIVHRVRAMFVGEFGGKLAKIARSHNGNIRRRG